MEGNGFSYPQCIEKFLIGQKIPIMQSLFNQNVYQISYDSLPPLSIDIKWVDGFTVDATDHVRRKSVRVVHDQANT
jgi:hypothetical protein